MIYDKLLWNLIKGFGMGSKYQNLSKEELIKIIEKQEQELKNKKYGLVWDSEREPEQVVLDCENHLPVLKRVKSKEIKTDDSQDNILIEGDNYHALTVLNYTHKGKIDMIYIDPPYNTGNKDFIYNDRYVDKEDGFRHSKWLNFMEKRLKLAYELLKDDGVLFCSIDDNEYPRLIMLLEKIFGEEKIKTICVKMSEPTGVKMSHVIRRGGIAKLKEYIVIAKKDGIKNLFLEKIPKKQWDNEYKIIITNATEKQILRVKEIRDNEQRTEEDINECDKIIASWEFEPLSSYFKKNNIPKEAQENFKYQNAWRIFRTAATTGNVKKLSDQKRNHVAGNIFSVVTPQKKLYLILKNYNSEQPQPRIKILFADDYLTQSPGDFWADIKTTGLDSEGNVDFKNGKKPIKLIERLIKSVNKSNLIILDFFAGSGATGEVVLKLNKEDNKIRRFILCNSNEEQICEKITFKRIQYAISKYGGNLQYFKTTLIQKSKNRDQLKIDLTQKATEMLCVKENIYNLEKEGEDYKIFSSNKKDRFLCIYYNFIDDSFNEFLEELKKLNGKKIIYMFAIDNKVDKSLFSELDDFTIEPIPQKILDVYNQLVKMNIPIKAETIFIDLEKAKKQIFENEDKDTGAKILRVVLEKILQKIAQLNQINILNDKGKEIRISNLNNILYQNRVFTQVEWQENQTYLTIGNHAAHGEYDEYNLEQVKNFYKHVQSLIEKFDI